ncbi:murein L,D-transpeptidase [Bradyrhizobium sp. 180]|uniref:L,D-transpeptidase family protein n=1 Tax=unclassified Bradyrhizobium TaxID=2631580 RepID=UPI001FF78155|nr:MULTISPECIES: murein L,D-transpeptidase family protein [unclassified Bradyrhizobium]MCK1419856.1 murein L,D-transpeptidase [Bradyrhizobium sp. CW12]MCK1492844.1 murein L,D-transpeptidase [Bradyrhizobium sp. 180]MCK1529527.1 murein L,D-transpeptidase [Bradyrhizobium sp. 182]MCK1593730.1 murein L,D-transpeptidase [Bradyrhizobium sp. 164]MCK1646119.1 murein L,D-transpeptidase [Bradyrhizobium sp. 154]
MTAGVLLTGCDTDQVSLATNAKANQPVPPKLLAAMTEKDMDLQSPILVRLFKQEAELEVWKQTRSGQFALLKTYPICRWSGDLGPKVREGDRQAPEGFYSINPSQMNPQSAYYLSFNTGYPNAFDKALGRTGSQLMVHGDCSSRGCYAMTDEQIAEIYSLGRESFFGGQKAFQLQAYPFKMTPVNMAKHRNNPNMPFWKMIKEGYDHFEVTRQEPKVDFCEKKYVFDAAKPADAKRDPVFDASAKCPAYVIPEDIARAVREKQAKDEAEYAKLVAKGTPVARMNTGIDGGMNKIFAAKIPEGSTGLSEGAEGTTLQMLAMAKAPGTIPGHVNPPKPNLDAAASAPAPQDEPLTASSAPATSTRVASAAPSEKSQEKSQGGFFSNLGRKMGLGTADTTATTPAPQATASVAPTTTTPPTAASRLKAAVTRFVPGHDKSKDAAKEAPKAIVAAKPAKQPDTRLAATRPALKPSVSDGAADSGQMAGAAPVVQSSSFDSRFGAVK